MIYSEFIKELDSRLKSYFELHKEHIHCKIGCSACCEQGDYPLSQIELEYIMQGYAKLNSETKKQIQNNIKLMKKGSYCPFLINKQCSIYEYRPIICRVHGLAYICRDSLVKVPYCARCGKNYSKVFDGKTILINPISEKLDTQDLIKQLGDYEIRNLIDWINK